MQRGLIDAGTRRPDLVVLDLGLPDGDGVDFIRSLRAWSQVPVIVLSARNDEAHKIAALDAGADDYLVKPFGAGELMARVRAQLRRHLQQTPDGETVLRFGDVIVDLAHHRMERSGEAVHLTPIEYRLLTHLAAQPDRVITHRELLKALWGPSHARRHPLRARAHGQSAKEDRGRCVAAPPPDDRSGHRLPLRALGSRTMYAIPGPFTSTRLEPGLPLL